MPRKTAAEKAAEKAAEEAAAAEAARRKTERQRLTWAGLFLAGVALFAVGYMVGTAQDDDTIVGSDTAIGAQGAVIPHGQNQDQPPGVHPGRRGGGVDRAPGPDFRDQDVPGQPDDDGDDDTVQVFQPGYLGVGVQRSPAGVRVTEVAPNSPAAAAGFEVDDVVVSFDGMPIIGVGEFAQLVRLDGAGSEAEIVVQRGGSEVTLTATLAPIPD